MYADSRMRPRFQPVSFGAALLVNGAIIGTMLMIAPNVLPANPPVGPIVTYDVKDKPPPQPVEDKIKPKDTSIRETVIVAPPVPILIPQDGPIIRTVDNPPLDPPPADLGTPKGTGEIIAPPPVLPLISASIDPRFAKDFQPEYPGSELRANRDGYVTVRVRIGTDGRVKEVSQVKATSPAFFEATRKHAISRWRFKPATRGGEPQESWKTMNVRFEMTGG